MNTLWIFAVYRVAFDSWLTVDWRLSKRRRFYMKGCLSSKLNAFYLRLSGFINDSKSMQWLKISRNIKYSLIILQRKIFPRCFIIHLHYVWRILLQLNIETISNPLQKFRCGHETISKMDLLTTYTKFNNDSFRLILKKEIPNRKKNPIQFSECTMILIWNITEGLG